MHRIVCVQSRDASEMCVAVYDILNKIQTLMGLETATQDCEMSWRKPILMDNVMKFANPKKKKIQSILITSARWQLAATVHSHFDIDRSHITNPRKQANSVTLRDEAIWVSLKLTNQIFTGRDRSNWKLTIRCLLLSNPESSQQKIETKTIKSTLKVFGWGDGVNLKEPMKCVYMVVRNFQI